ncbi:related to dioxygenase [Ramularia collo-cygni]|uniref:Related to dioxygenase n=1 Tax=Ramularia collo-cygni TaxID=112498 RepID=A0A2D3V6I6_9PEZI|nr:related to dioxygenase [Ramularia collo-cygni]CZT23583.1 related to dioxygenase [Ramularia collo-cygni]
MMSTDSPTLKHLTKPPGTTTPYVISSQEGEILHVPLTKSATRLLVTGLETEDSYGLVGWCGSQSDPIGFHYHKHTHEVLLCLKGSVNVWIDDEFRTMAPGDFADIPPNTIHRYQILGNHSEMIGLTVPGGLEDFFRVIGEPYNGPLWPMNDQRNVFEFLVPELKAAAEHFDIIPLPHHKPSVTWPWENSGSISPGKKESYFLQCGSGPAWLAGGTLVRPLITTAESDGNFAIASIEGSSHHAPSDLLAAPQRISFPKTHHAFLISEGRVEFSLEESSYTLLHAGDIIYVPRGTVFRYQIRSRYAKMYVFASGKGIVELLIGVGEECYSPILPETAEKRIDPAMLSKVARN